MLVCITAEWCADDYDTATFSFTAARSRLPDERMTGSLTWFLGPDLALKLFTQSPLPGPSAACTSGTGAVSLGPCDADTCGNGHEKCCVCVRALTLPRSCARTRRAPSCASRHPTLQDLPARGSGSGCRAVIMTTDPGM